MVTTVVTAISNRDGAGTIINFSTSITELEDDRTDTSRHFRATMLAKGICVKDFWKKLNIRDVISYLVSAWNHITITIINHVWASLLPQLKTRQDKTRQHQEAVEPVRSVWAPWFCDIIEKQMQELKQWKKQSQCWDARWWRKQRSWTGKWRTWKLK